MNDVFGWHFGLMKGNIADFYDKNKLFTDENRQS